MDGTIELKTTTLDLVLVFSGQLKALDKSLHCDWCYFKQNLFFYWKHLHQSQPIQIFKMLWYMYTKKPHYLSNIFFY